MSISRVVFERGDFFNARHESDVAVGSVAQFLSKNKRKAYEVKEIMKCAKVSKDKAYRYLKKLVKKGLVEHKSPYYAWKVSATKKSKKKVAFVGKKPGKRKSVKKVKK